MKAAYRGCGLLLLSLGFLWACAFDTALREYLSGNFWLPFAKGPSSFEKPGVPRINAPFAGMTITAGDTPLERLRIAYFPLSEPEERPSFDVEESRQAVAAARSDPSLTPKEKEEVALLDAKIDLRAGEPDRQPLLASAKKKLTDFLATAHTPEYLSEARGWLARIAYLSGDQTAAGKIYLDELNRAGSNLSRQTLLNSLRMTYGYDGGDGLLQHLEDYFDTPEHAAFAIQLVTNPHWPGDYNQFERDPLLQSYPRIKALLAQHASLLQAKSGSGTLALLAMRTALRMGDPREARAVGQAVPANAAVRGEPDFNWMLASAYFLNHQYASAARPLLALFRSPQASPAQKSAAGYGLCGVYQKTGNIQEQLRYALWLRTARTDQDYVTIPAGVEDLSIYWAASGWDLNLLLDAQASIEDLQAFITRNPSLHGIRLVKYSLAVRLTRENRYAEAADLYQSIHALPRAARMRQLAALYAANDKYALAQFISAHEDGIYFNDAIWAGYQRYALQASGDYRLTRAERQKLIALERKLQDDQEEFWRAYLILRDVVDHSHESSQAHKAAILALQCLRGINDRFGRQDDIRKADIDLLRWLARK
jgi:hypothetical protein